MNDLRLRPVPNIIDGHHFFVVDDSGAVVATGDLIIPDGAQGDFTASVRFVGETIPKESGT